MSNPIHDESLLRGFVNRMTCLNRLRQAIYKRRAAVEVLPFVAVFEVLS